MWCWEVVVIGFIFRSCIRGLMPCSVFKLIEMLTIQERSLGHHTELPRVYHKTHSSLPLDGQGSADALLVETHPGSGVSGWRQDSQSSG